MKCEIIFFLYDFKVANSGVSVAHVLYLYCDRHKFECKLVG